MAQGISFLDLLLAEAVVSHLQAREAQPPDNFKELVSNPEAWKRIQAACKESNMVIVLEITSDSHLNCKRIQPKFIQLAREFDELPFLRATIGPGASFAQLREDVGGVEYTPTFLVVFFDDDKTTIAQYEGTDAIMGALASKRIHAVIQEFVRRRAKLKMAERMAGLLALRVAGMMIGAQQQQEARSTFEGRMRRLAEDSDRGDSEAAKKEKMAELRKKEETLSDLRRKLQEEEASAKKMREDIHKI